MTEINPKYNGTYNIAIIKENGNYVARGTFERDLRRRDTIGPETLEQNFVGVLSEICTFEKRLEKWKKEDSVVAIYWKVGLESAKPIAKAVDKLRNGEEVDLENLLR